MVFGCCCFCDISGLMSQVNLEKWWTVTLCFIFKVFQVMLHNSGEYWQDSTLLPQDIGAMHIPSGSRNKPAPFKRVFSVVTLILISWKVDNMTSITSYLSPASKYCWIIGSLLSRSVETKFIFRGKGITPVLVVVLFSVLQLCFSLLGHCKEQTVIKFSWWQTNCMEAQTFAECTWKW